MPFKSFYETFKLWLEYEDSKGPQEGDEEVEENQDNAQEEIKKLTSRREMQPKTPPPSQNHIPSPGFNEY